MFDFFDEDFPLSKKQEEELKKRLAAEAVEVGDEAAESKGEKPAPEAETVVIEAPPADDSGDIVIGKIESELDDEDEYGDEDDYIDGEEDAEAETVEEVEEQPEPAPAPVVEPVELPPETVLREPSPDEAEKAEEQPAPEEQSAPGEAEAEEIPEEEIPAEEHAPEPQAEDIPEGPAEPQTDVQSEPPEHVMPAGAAEEIPGADEMNERIATIDELQANLHAELKNLGEKLDSMERVVDGMEDAEIAEGFDYEYDGRYFAEEETPAYRHPELYGKRSRPAAKPAAAKPAQREIKINTSTLVKAGAAIAAAVVAAKLLGSKKDDN